MAFVAGLVVLGVVFWFLMRLKQQDLAHCREVLGLAAAPSATSRGTTPEGFSYSQTTLLQGTMNGCPAVLSARTVGVRTGPPGRRRGSQFTVLDLTLPRPVRTALRLQPAGMLGGLEDAMRGPASDRVPIDAPFDVAYVVYSNQAADARAVLTPATREALLAFHARFVGDHSAPATARLASALVLGTFQLQGTAASYVLFGSPTKAVAEHLKAAVPLLLELAAAAS